MLRAKRLPLVLLVAARCVWSFAVLDHFPVRLESLMYAVALYALGVGLWPGRLPLTPLEPQVVGFAIALYGAFAVAAILLGAGGLFLLEAAPIALVLGLGAVAIWRQLPPLEPPMLAGRLAAMAQRARVAMESTSALVRASLVDRRSAPAFTPPARRRGLRHGSARLDRSAARRKCGDTALACHRSGTGRRFGSRPSAGATDPVVASLRRNRARRLSGRRAAMRTPHKLRSRRPNRRTP